MNRREFLTRIFKTAGFAGLVSLGLTTKEIDAFASWYYGAASTCDVCSDGLTFAWHCENVDVTLGNPCGCSVGDTVASLNGTAAISDAQKSDGTNSAYFPNGSDWYDFTISSYDIISDTAGTVTLDFYVDTWEADTRLLLGFGHANDRLVIGLSGTEEVTIYYKGSGSAVQLNTNDATLLEDTWYTLTAKWRQGETDPSMSIQITGEGTEATTNTNLTDMTNEWTQLAIGPSEVAGEGIYIDNIKIYNSWL